MTITKTITLEANDDMIDNILEELLNECESWANTLLDRTGFDLEWNEYKDYCQKLTKEIFNDVVTRLTFDSKAE